MQKEDALKPKRWNIIYKWRAYSLLLSIEIEIPYSRLISNFNNQSDYGNQTRVQRTHTLCCCKANCFLTTEPTIAS